MSTLQAEEIRRRDEWDRALSELGAHTRARREQRAWHPLWTPGRRADDLRYTRERRLLVASEYVARARFARVCAIRNGYHTVPLISGLHRLFTDRASAVAFSAETLPL